MAVAHGLSWSTACGVFLDQGWNLVSCIGRWALYPGSPGKPIPAIWMLLPFYTWVNWGTEVIWLPQSSKARKGSTGDSNSGCPACHKEKSRKGKVVKWKIARSWVCPEAKVGAEEMWEINRQGIWGCISKGPKSLVVSLNFLLLTKGSCWKFLSREYCYVSCVSEDSTWNTAKWGVSRQEEKLGTDCGGGWEWGSVTVMRVIKKTGLTGLRNLLGRWGLGC